MKHFIAICIFAIGLMFTLPTSGYSSSSPPGQVSFVADYQLGDMAAVQRFDQITIVTDHFVGINETIVEKGGGVEVQEFVSVTQRTNLIADKVIMQSINFKQFASPNFCYRYENSLISKIIIQNIESRSRCTIRADSQA